MKSNRMLRKYKMKTKRVQRCSKCKQIGHNSSNKRCSSNVDLSDFIEDAEDEEGMLQQMRPWIVNMRLFI